MRNIWKTVPGNWTITDEQNVKFLTGLYPENFQQNNILNGRLTVIISPPFNFFLINKVGLLQFRSRRWR